MKKRWWFLILLIIILGLIFLVFVFSKVNVIINSSPAQVKDENTTFGQEKGLISRVDVKKELLCSCIGFNLRQSYNENILRCYGIGFNCLERCNAYIFKQGIEGINIVTVPCDCGQTCKDDLLKNKT
jgi:hypothetical protein